MGYDRTDRVSIRLLRAVSGFVYRLHRDYASGSEEQSGLHARGSRVTPRKGNHLLKDWNLEGTHPIKEAMEQRLIRLLR